MSAPATPSPQTPGSYASLAPLVRAELFKLRTTSTWWLFAVAFVVSTTVVLVVDFFTAHSLFKPLAQYLDASSHGHGGTLPSDFRAHLVSDWTAGHSAVTQAATIYTAGQLIGLLLAGLLGVVVMTSEYQQQTATSTFLVTPRRSQVFVSKLITAVLVASLAWLASTVLSLVAGAVFLHTQGYGTELTHPGVVRAVVLNLAAYLVWAVLGVGFGAVVRNQLAATVSATVLYLAGTAAAASVFELVNTYLIPHTWVLTAQVVVPSVASAVMISPTKTFTESPSQLTGALVLLAYGAVFAAWGVRMLRRRDIG